MGALWVCVLLRVPILMGNQPQFQDRRVMSACIRTPYAGRLSCCLRQKAKMHKAQDHKPALVRS